MSKTINMLNTPPAYRSHDAIAETRPATKIILHSKHLAPVIGLVLLCVVLFANTFQNEFLWDDNYLITDNQYIKSIKNIPLFFTPHYWNSLHPLISDGLYRPVRTVTLAVDYFFWQLRPAGYHLTNLLLHTGNVLLVYCLIHLLTGGLKPNDENKRLLFSLPLLTALLFAAHPVHTESIAFIKNRSELLACLFSLLTLIFFIKTAQADRSWLRIFLLTAALVCFGLAVCSKEVALILPAILVLYTACFLFGEKRRNAILSTLPFWVGALLFFWFRQTMLATSPETASALPMIPTAPDGLWQTLLTVFKTFSRYLSLLLFPVNLHITPAFQVPRTLLTPTMAASTAALLALGLLIVSSYKRSKLLCFSTCWILLTLLPASNIIYFASRPIAEQRLYLPSLGFCLIAAMALNRLYASATRTGIKPFRHARNIAAVMLVAVLVFYSCQTVRRNNVWRSQFTFWTDAANKSPQDSEPYNGLGMAYNSLKKYDHAIDCFQKGLALQQTRLMTTDTPITAELYCNIGVAYSQTGQNKAADEAFQKALALYKKKADPGHSVMAKLYNNISLVCINRADHDNAIRYLKQALYIHLQHAGRQNPGTASMYNNLGGAYFKKGDYAQAIPYLREALQIKTEILGANHPTLATGYDNLGVTYYLAGDYAQAITLLKKALKLYERQPAETAPEITAVRQRLAVATQKYQEQHF